MAAPLHEKDPSQLVDRYTAAKVLDVSPRTLDGWRTRGTGPPHVKLAGRTSPIKYQVGDLLAYISAQKRKARVAS